MKTIAVTACILAALTAYAQPPSAEGSLESQLTSRLGKTGTSSLQAAKPNEIVKGRVTYSGIAVQALKTRKPLQLINPAAPPQYGSPEDNLLRNPVSGEVSGWKLFSIRF